MTMEEVWKFVGYFEQCKR